jgi:hypothetical protein
MVLTMMIQYAFSSFKFQVLTMGLFNVMEIMKIFWVTVCLNIQMNSGKVLLMEKNTMV